MFVLWLFAVLCVSAYTSTLPIGMEEWYQVDHCGEPYWSEFFRIQLDNDVSLESLLALLREPVLNPTIGFRCATAVAAGCERIAKKYDQLGKKNLSLRFRQLSSIFLSFDFTMKGSDWIDSSGHGIQWTGSIESVLNNMKEFQKFDFLARNLTMREFLGSEKKFEKLQIAIVTVCDYDSKITNLGSLSRKNKQKYADRHGYSLFFFDQAPRYSDWFEAGGGIYSGRPAAWSKIDAMLIVMAENENLDWLMWMDCDSFFMDMEVRIEDIVGKSKSEKKADKIEFLAKWVPTSPVDAIREFNTLAYAPGEAKQIIISEDGLMLNSGIFFVTRSNFSYFFLQRVRQFTFNKNPTTFHSWWEQTAMVLLFAESLFEAELDWPPFVEPFFQKQLNVYPPLIASMLSTHVSYSPGDYIISFSGCKIYTSQAVCNHLFENYFYL